MILLISNNKDLSNAFVQDLKHEGFPVEIRRKAPDIGTFLHKKPHFKMLILDLESIHTKAPEIFQRIKKDPKLKFIPIICIIKKDLILEQLIAFELGADDFIFFPYTTVELQLKMRAIQGLLNLQNQLKEQENRLNALGQTQKILVTISHHINNSLTPLYGLIQILNECSPEDFERLKNTAKQTIEFIQKVLLSLNNLVGGGEMRIVQDGIYKNLLLDIEEELKKLYKNIR
jgi:response regulator RpfG family c-di-GMP phosphodiesterase